MTTTKNTAEATATRAQADRLILIRKDTTNRITLRKAANGAIVVSEYDRATGDVSRVTMGTDGLYS